MRTLSLALAALLPLAAMAGLASGQVIGGSLGNLAPVIANVVINDPDGTVLPNAGGTRSIVATATVTDANGFLDLSESGGVTMAMVFGGSDVIAEAAAPRVSGNLLTGTYERTFDVPYYFAPGTYTIRVEAIDLALATDDDTSRTFTYDTLLAASPGASVALGSGLSPGDTGSIVSLAVQNTGNAVIDVQVVAAADLAHETEDAHIAASSVSYGTASNLAGSSALATSGPPTLTGFSLATATSGGASSGNLYFRLAVPTVAASPDGHLPAGDYETTLTVTAVANS